MRRIIEIELFENLLVLYLDNKEAHVYAINNYASIIISRNKDFNYSNPYRKLLEIYMMGNNRVKFEYELRYRSPEIEEYEIDTENYSHLTNALVTRKSKYIPYKFNSDEEREDFKNLFGIDVKDMIFKNLREHSDNVDSFRYFEYSLGLSHNHTKLPWEEERPELNVDIEKVVYNDPATIIFWADGTKTVVKCQEGDTYDPEKGLAMAICKKALGTNKSKSNFNDIFKKWLPKED